MAIKNAMHPYYQCVRATCPADLMKFLIFTLKKANELAALQNGPGSEDTDGADGDTDSLAGLEGFGDDFRG